MKIAFISLGCKVNNYEVDAIKDLFIQSGVDGYWDFFPVWIFCLFC